MLTNLVGEYEKKTANEENARRRIEESVQMRKDLEQLHRQKLLPKAQHGEEHDPQHTQEVPVPTN